MSKHTTRRRSQNACTLAGTNTSTADGLGLWRRWRCLKSTIFLFGRSRVQDAHDYCHPPHSLASFLRFEKAEVSVDRSHRFLGKEGDQRDQSSCLVPYLVKESPLSSAAELPPSRAILERDGEVRRLPAMRRSKWSTVCRHRPVLRLEAGSDSESPLRTIAWPRHVTSSTYTRRYHCPLSIARR